MAGHALDAGRCRCLANSVAGQGLASLMRRRELRDQPLTHPHGSECRDPQPRPPLAVSLGTRRASPQNQTIKKSGPSQPKQIARSGGRLAELGIRFFFMFHHHISRVMR